MSTASGLSHTKCNSPPPTTLKFVLQHVNHTVTRQRDWSTEFNAVSVLHLFWCNANLTQVCGSASNIPIVGATIVDDVYCSAACPGNSQYLCGSGNLLSYYSTPWRLYNYLPCVYSHRLLGFVYAGWKGVWELSAVDHGLWFRKILWGSSSLLFSSTVAISFCATGYCLFSCLQLYIM